MKPKNHWISREIDCECCGDGFFPIDDTEEICPDCQELEEIRELDLQKEIVEEQSRNPNSFVNPQSELRDLVQIQPYENE